MTFVGAFSSIGANVEFRPQPARGSGFYVSGFLGGEIVFSDRNWLDQDGPDFVLEGLIPHVAGGMVYQWEFGDRNWFFVELKAGLMMFAGSRRLGMIF